MELLVNYCVFSSFAVAFYGASSNPRLVALIAQVRYHMIFTTILKKLIM